MNNEWHKYDMHLYRDSFQNYKVYQIPKAQLIIADVPYNLGTNAYGSNPSWYVDGDNKNGESDKAGKKFFNSENEFRPAEFMHFCSKMLVKEPKESRMRKKSYKTVNLTKINIAHREACAKHPKFCDDFTGAREWFIVDELERWRKVNSVAPYHADAILNEEILEALEAYKQGDLKNCLQELAQCGAVILRMMQFVLDEMEA